MPNIEFPENWTRWLTETDIDGNSAGRWLLGLGVFLVVGVVFRVAKSILLARAARLAERTDSSWDDAVVTALQRTKWWFLLVLSAFCGSLILVLPGETRTVAQSIVILALLAQTALWGNVLITAGVEQHMKHRLETDPASVMTVAALAFVGKLVLFAVLVLLALDNLGINVTTLIAGLGVGGIAVALAVQNILGDLFASLSIVFDKPFVLGDFVVVGDQLGTVEKIGLKTTRLRSLSGEQLVFANNDLLQSRIRNFKRMYERRIVFSLGVTYQTPRHKLEQIPPMLREIVESHEHVRFDRAHFKEFTDSSLNFEIVYYVLTPDYNLYMDIQQAINLEIYKRFEKLGVEFAYPTQTLFMERVYGEA